MKSWGAARSSCNTQTANTRWRRRVGRKRSFMCRLPARHKFWLLLPILVVRRVRHSQAFHQVVAHSKCVGHDGERRIYGSARWEETPVHKVEIVEVMGFAVRVQGGSLRVMSKANRAVLMGNASERNSLSDVKV